jgi:hypothetical protein
MDEIDCLLLEFPTYSKAEVMFCLWDLAIGLSITLGAFVYISGRSTIMHSLGKQRFENIGLRSPSRSMFLIFNPLPPAKIKQLIMARKDNICAWDSERLNIFVEILFTKTKGVPLMVVNALDITSIYLTTDSEHDDIVAFLLNAVPQSFNVTDENMIIPLRQFKEISPALLSLYYTLLSFAQFSVPIDASTILNVEQLGINSITERGQTELDIIELISLVGFYIEQTFINSKTYCKVVAPEYSTEAVQRYLEGFVHGLAPSVLSYTADFISSGNLLERLIHEALKLQLTSTSPTITFDSLFPFLKFTSLAGIQIGKWNSEIIVFPHIYLLKKGVDHNQAMSRLLTAENPSVTIEVPVNLWEFAQIRFIKENSIAVPYTKNSVIGDALLCVRDERVFIAENSPWNNRSWVIFQDKNWATPVTKSVVEHESQIISYFPLQASVTLVIIARSVSDELIDNGEGHSVCTIARANSSPATIIILLQDALKMFLGPNNFKVLTDVATGKTWTIRDAYNEFQSHKRSGSSEAPLRMFALLYKF